MSTISYAQAAKGQAASQPTSQPITGSPQSTSSQTKDEVPTANTSVTTPSVASSDAGSPDTGKNGHSDAEVTLPRHDAEMAEESAPSTTSAADQSVKSSRLSDATTVDSHPRQDGKASRSTSRAPRSNEGPEGRRGRKGKKGRNHDKDAQTDQQQQDEKEKEKEKEKVVLSEAPLPAVNIWKQRQEQKAKQAPPPVPAASNVSTNGGESRKPHVAQEEADSQLSNGVPKDKSAKKSADQPKNGEQAPRRSAPRGARGNEKDDKPSGNLPSVEDTSAWPDPKAAASNEVAGQKPQAKAAPAEREGGSDSRQSQPRSWQKIDVPHSVVFNTQLPARGGGHRSRGGGRGGRETGSTREPQSSNGTSSGSAQNAATEKPAVANGIGPAKGSTHQPRENSTSTRPASQNPAPAVPKRGPVDLPPSKDQRKPSISAQESVREPASDNAAPSSKKASHRAPHGDIRIPNGESGSALPKSAPQERPTKSFEPSKDGQNGNHNQQHGAREGRPERGRGGYRGRGGHNGATGQHSQPNSYAQNGQYSAPPFQQRPGVSGPGISHSGQFAGYGQSSRGRGAANRWSGSGRSNSNGAVYAPRPAPHAPQVGEPLVQQYPPAYYPAAQPVFEQFTLNMVTSQLNYYFSVDNLCRDMYLRKQMNCQGFVKLDVIAGFKRMRDILATGGGIDLLRFACQYTDVVELVMGEDQVDRLRRREKWKDFVLKADERMEELQHDSPINFTPYNAFLPYPAPVTQQYAVTSPVHMWNPQFPEDAAYLTGGYPAQFEQNGIVPNGHHYGQEPQLSAGVPDFMPNSATFELENLTNIPDACFDRVKILEKASSDSSSASAAGYISNNTHMPVTNGNPSHNSEAPNGVDNSSGAPTWFADQSDETPVQERPYTEVKQAALAQREQAEPGETPEQMRYLYKVWSQILLRHFNANVYHEFRNLAIQDAARENLYGLRCLVAFLENVLKDDVHKPWLHPRQVPHILKLHYDEAVDSVQRSPASAVEKSI
ncbi:La-related protein 1A [Rhypophila decipiens]